MHWILDENGEPKAVDVYEWGEWFESATKDRRRVLGLTNLGSLGEVSTVFLGLDHSFVMTPGEDHKPVLWESMIFGGPLAEDQERYSSKDAALKGHKRMVKRLQKIKDLIIQKFSDAWGELSEEDLQRAVDTVLRLGGIEYEVGDGDIAIIIKVGDGEEVRIEEVETKEALADVIGPES